jgi:hypothetical protein
MANGMKNILPEGLQATVTTETAPQKRSFLRRFKH